MDAITEHAVALRPYIERARKALPGFSEDSILRVAMANYRLDERKLRAAKMSGSPDKPKTNP